MALPTADKDAAESSASTEPPRLPSEAGIAARIQAADGLCDLLRSAQMLLKPLSFMVDVSQAVPLLLQRALLFRAYEEFRDGCPDAVALLMRAGSPFYKQLWTAESIEKIRRVGFGMAEVPSASLLKVVLADVIENRTQVGRQVPCAPDLFKSVTEVKEHFRMYLGEIERGPQDLAFRHFLLLGAFAEILHRTQLPPASAERFRQAMTEGKRRGAKAESVAYLTEALRGVVA